MTWWKKNLKLLQVPLQQNQVKKQTNKQDNYFTRHGTVLKTNQLIVT